MLVFDNLHGAWQNGLYQVDKITNQLENLLKLILERAKIFYCVHELRDLKKLKILLMPLSKINKLEINRTMFMTK
jgi:hypothetical protein